MPRVSAVGMFKRLSGLFVPRQMLLFAMLLAGSVGMRRCVLQFGGTLVVLIMRSVVVTS
jgi:hypothetical protein